MGARVVAVARGAAKLDVARKAGATECLDSGATGFDLRAELKALGGAHVIYDAIGEPLATPAMRALLPEGRFLAIGFAGGHAACFSGQYTAGQEPERDRPVLGRLSALCTADHGRVYRHPV